MNNNIILWFNALMFYSCVSNAMSEVASHAANTNQAQENEAEELSLLAQIPDSISCAAGERYTFLASALVQKMPDKSSEKQLECLVRDAFNYYLQAHAFAKNSSFIVDGGISLSIEMLKQNPQWKTLLEPLLSDPLQLNAVEGNYSFAFQALDKAGNNILTKQNYPQMVAGFQKFLQDAPKVYKAGMKLKMDQSLQNRAEAAKDMPPHVKQVAKGDYRIPEAMHCDAAIGYMKVLYYLEFLNDEKVSDLENSAAENLIRNFFFESFEYFVQSRLTCKLKSDKIDAAIRLVFFELQKQDKFKKLIEQSLHNPLRHGDQKPKNERWSTRLENDGGLVNENYNEVVKKYRAFLLQESPQSK